MGTVALMAPQFTEKCVTREPPTTACFVQTGALLRRAAMNPGPMVTCPDGLTSLAASSETSPIPQPRSSTLSPGPCPADRRNCSVHFQGTSLAVSGALVLALRCPRHSLQSDCGRRTFVNSLHFRAKRFRVAYVPQVEFNHQYNISGARLFLF